MKESNDFNFGGKPEAAFPKADSARQIYEQVLGRETAEVAAALNQIGLSFLHRKLLDDALSTFEKMLAIRLKVLGKDHVLVAHAHNNIATTYKEKGNYEKMIDNHLKSIKIREKHYGLGSPFLTSAYMNLGNGYYLNNDFYKSVEYSEKAVGILLATKSNNLRGILGLYNNLAVAYTELGQYERAKEYYEKVLKTGSQVWGDNDPNLTDNYANFGILLVRMGDYDKAIDYAQKALNIRLKKTKLEKIDCEIYVVLSGAYNYKKDYEKAVFYAQKAIAIQRQLTDADHPDMALLYNDIGLIYDNYGKSDSALLYLQKAIDNQLKKASNNIGFTYTNMGQVYHRAKDYDKAVLFFQKSLAVKTKILKAQSPALAETYNLLAKTYLAKKDYENAENCLKKSLNISNYKQKNDFSTVNDKIHVLNALDDYAVLLLDKYAQTAQKEDAERAADFAQQAAYGIEDHLEGLHTEGSQILLKAQRLTVYDHAIAANILLAKTDKNALKTAFQYAEQSKAWLLQAQIKATRALHFADIPDNLLQKEDSLRTAITWFEKQKQAQLNAGKAETDSVVLGISNTLFLLKQDIYALKKNFEHLYPKYYQLKYAVSTLTVKDIQQSLLNADQTLIEYFVADSSIFIFTINQTDFDVVEVKNDFDLDSLVAQMRYGISNYHSKNAPNLVHNAAPAAYTEGSSKLYKMLIEPVKNRLKKQLIIVPDGVLGYIPFEALLMKHDAKPNRFHANTYLINDYNISYAYSAAMLKEMSDKKHLHEPTASLLAMAPFFSGDTTVSADIRRHPDNSTDTLQILPASGPEAANCVQLMTGLGVYGKDATLQKFLELAPQYRFLHLTTHGKANDKLGDYSYLAFFNTKDSLADKLLYVRDLYNLQLNADMVVLSACETGIGQLHRGEGIASLARAFSYAGAKSIVTTLWQIGDGNSKILMTNFYKHLQKGDSKAVALSKAKRDFINADKIKNSDPFFWAGFILIGDERAIKKN